MEIVAQEEDPVVPGKLCIEFEQLATTDSPSSLSALELLSKIDGVGFEKRLTEYIAWFGTGNDTWEVWIAT